MPDSVNVPKQPGYDAVFRSQSGPVGRDLDRRASRVLNAARRQVGVRSGALRNSMEKQWRPARRDRLTIRLTASTRYATMHHDGTRPHVITPRTAKVLRFVNRQGQVVFARRVNHPGTAPNRYFLDNLPIAMQ